MENLPHIAKTHHPAATFLPDPPQPLDYLQGLQSLVNALGSAQTVEAVAEVIIDHAFPIMGMDVGIVALLSEDGTMLETLRQRGAKAEQHADRKAVSIFVNTPLTVAFQQQRTIMFRDKGEFLVEFPDFYSWEDWGEGAGIAIPMMLNNRPIGAIRLSYREPRSYSAWEVTFVETVAA